VRLTAANPPTALTAAAAALKLLGLQWMLPLLLLLAVVRAHATVCAWHRC
jgi:hypothetical protein